MNMRSDEIFSFSASAPPRFGACRMVLCVAVYGRKNVRKTGRLPDTVPARVLLCAIFALGFSLIHVVRGGTELYDILSLALNTVCAASFAFLLSFFFEPEYRFTPAFEAGLGAAAFCLSLSLSGISIGSFSIGLVVSYMITLYVGWLGPADAKLRGRPFVRPCLRRDLCTDFRAFRPHRRHLFRGEQLACGSGIDCRHGLRRAVFRRDGSHRGVFAGNRDGVRFDCRSRAAPYSAVVFHADGA